MQEPTLLELAVSGRGVLRVAFGPLGGELVLYEFGHFGYGENHQGLC